MAKFIVVFLFLAGAGTFFWILRMIGHAVTGNLKKLPRKDEGRDDPRRGLYLYGNDFARGPGASSFQELRDSMCPLHNKPYCGMTVFAIAHPPRKLTVSAVTTGAFNHVIVERCHLLSCPDCLKEAHRYRSFTWYRANRPQHPVWASTQLYEHLLKDLYASVHQVSVPLPYEGDACPPVEPPVPPTVPDQVQALLEELSTLGKKTIFGTKPKPFHAAPDFPEHLMSDHLASVNQSDVNAPPVLADHVVALSEGSSWFLLTMEAIYTFAPSAVTVRRRAFADVKAIDVSPNKKKLMVDSKPVPVPAEIKGDDIPQFTSKLHSVLTHMVEESRKTSR